MNYSPYDKTPYDVALDSVTPVLLTSPTGSLVESMACFVANSPDTYAGKIYFEIRKVDRTNPLTANNPTAAEVKKNTPLQCPRSRTFHVDGETAVWAILDAGSASFRCQRFVRGKN